MTYIYKPNTNGKKHIWNGKKEDTWCKMWSTGGIQDKDKWRATKRNVNRDTCKMCKHNKNKHRNRN